MCPLQAFFSVKSLLAKSVIKLSVLIKVVYNVTSICIYSRYVYLAQTQEKNEGQKDKCFKLINILSVRVEAVVLISIQDGCAEETWPV